MNKNIIIQDVKQLVGSKFMKDTSVYFFANLLRSCIPFLMLPIMTAYLSKSDYGIISMLTTVISFATPFVTLDLRSAIQRRYYYKNEKISEYIGNCFILSFLALLLVQIVFLIFNIPLSRYTGVPRLFLLLVPVYCYLTLFENAIMAYWQVNQQPVKYGIMQILHTAIELSLAILLIVALQFNWEGRAISILSIGVLFSFISIVILSKNKLIDLTFNKDKMLHALKFGLGLIPHTVGASLIVMSNRFFITNMISIEETGIYGVATQLGGVMGFVTTSINNAYVPWLFKKLSSNNDESKKDVVKLAYGLLFALPFLGIMLFLAIKLIFPFFINSNFEGALIYVPWIILGAVFQGYYYIFTNFILYKEKTHYLAYITISMGLISVILNYVLIKFLGTTGVAISYAATFLVYFLLVFIVANRLIKLPWGLNIVGLKKNNINSNNNY